MTEQKFEWAGYIKVIWIGLSFSLVVLVAILGYDQSIAIFRQITLWQAVADLVVVVIIVTVYCCLARLHPVFKWWIGRIFTTKPTESGNFNLMGAYVPIVGPIYVILMAFVMPQVCRIEENLFREGTDNWQEAIWRSLLFGFAHLLVGVPVGAAVALSLAGLWFSYVYFQGGVEASTLHHTTYNLIVMLVVFVAVTAKQGHELMRRRSMKKRS